MKFTVNETRLTFVSRDQIFVQHHANLAESMV